MNWHLIGNPWFVLEKSGWTLLHSTWQLAIIAVLIGCILATQRSSRAKYRTAFVGLILMAITPVAFFVWSLSSSNSSADLFSAASAEPTVAIVNGMSVDARTQSPVEELAADSIVEAENAAESVSTATMTTASAPTATRRSFVVWLVPCWLVGVFLLSVRHIGGWYLAVRVVGHSALIKTHAARLFGPADTIDEHQSSGETISIRRSHHAHGAGSHSPLSHHSDLAIFLFDA